jgi:hypothetical protein
VAAISGRLHLASNAVSEELGVLVVFAPAVSG